MMRNLSDNPPKTMTIFLNMSTASAAIQNTAASVKYWIRSDIIVQTASFSVLSMPTRKNTNIPSIAVQSCMWNLVTSRCLYFLQRIQRGSLIANVRFSSLKGDILNARVPHFSYSNLSQSSVYHNLKLLRKVCFWIVDVH